MWDQLIARLFSLFSESAYIPQNPPQTSGRLFKFRVPDHSRVSSGLLLEQLYARGSIPGAFPAALTPPFDLRTLSERSLLHFLIADSPNTAPAVRAELLRRMPGRAALNNAGVGVRPRTDDLLDACVSHHA